MIHMLLTFQANEFAMTRKNSVSCSIISDESLSLVESYRV